MLDSRMGLASTMDMVLAAAEDLEDLEVVGVEDTVNSRRNGFLVAPRLPVAPR